MIDILYRIKGFLKRWYGVDKINDIDPYLEKFIVKYYEWFPVLKNGIRNRNAKRKLIISLTTIPNRIDKVWITIESLLRQTYKPDQIILWLAEEEFSGIELPEKLRRQIKRGVEIRYCDNLKSYKKFYYTMKENPDAYVITVDDDVIYSETMVKALVKTYRKNPGNVICHRSHLIKKRSTSCVPYDSWIKYEKRGKIRCNAVYANFFTSGGGVLFPIFLLDKKVLEKETFMKLAPTADDVWLNFICWISHLRIKNTEGVWGTLIYISDFSDNGLALQNVVRRRNDCQIKAVMEYLKIDINDYI